ncbi:flagellar biosynthetic protein FliQ [Arthrospira platensis SPKY1]|nr:flagellar biosynthetic protein FliQ [Arthrospira platensis SPKY1]
MNQEVSVYWMQEMLSMVVYLAGPLLAATLIVGLIVSIFQAATTVQEMTLSYVPKMVVVILILYFFFNAMLQLMISFTQRIMEFIPSISGGL